MDNVSIPPRILEGDLAGWLREAMAERRMSARMVGLRTGINHSTITRLLYGDRQASLTTTIALLRLLGSEPVEAPATDGYEGRAPAARYFVALSGRGRSTITRW